MMKILLVDDDPICNFLSKKALRQIGYVNEVNIALNGEQALNFFKNPEEPSSLPDVILLDLNMPVMDGFEFLEAFSKLNVPEKEKIRIIIVTSSNNRDDFARARMFGVSQYLTKPIQEDELFVALAMSDNT